MKSLFFPSILLATGLFLQACGGSGPKADEEAAPETEVRTPVTVTSVTSEDLEDVTELTAISTFLQLNVIKASANGYIKSVQIRLGQKVKAGQIAFTLRTKEAEALGNTVNNLGFHFTGMIPVKATAGGFIQELNHVPGDYVQDGDQLAVVTDDKSFGFVLNLPYELRKYVSGGQSMEIILPDGKKVNGRISVFLPDVDSTSQTQAVLLKVSDGGMIPRNLIARVRVVKERKSMTASLPKGAVLTDEAQTNFWVMKMIDSATAVKIPVMKGMETAERVEIIRPLFTKDDKILLTGNYGLPDTAKVIIQKNDE